MFGQSRPMKKMHFLVHGLASHDLTHWVVIQPGGQANRYFTARTTRLAARHGTRATHLVVGAERTTRRLHAW